MLTAQLLLEMSSFSAQGRGLGSISRVSGFGV